MKDNQSTSTCHIHWHPYKRNSLEPEHHPLDNSEIPCLVKMDDGEIWIAKWVIDDDYHRHPFTGWVFQSFWGDIFYFEEDNETYGREVIAFAYIKDVS
jgi:hypothetical protein